jgi:serine protease Do
MSFYDKAKSQKFLSFTLILFTLSIGVLIGTVIQTGAKAAHEQQAAPDATPLTVPPAASVPSEFTKIAKKLEPSVVNISTEYIPKKMTTQNRQTPQTRRRGQQAPQVDPNDQGGDDGGMQQFMQRFFGNGGGGGQFGDGMPDTPSAALGSGVVVDKNGYILTNNHVIEKATRIKVKFNGDPAEYTANVVGADPDTDLAVIHIDKKNLVAAKIGNSDAIQVGDWAVAIGSPFGFNATVTAGIVSALARDVPDNDNPGRSFQHFIQTDAAINPGNSGGPLLNINGEVIGINTMIASRSGGNQGIGFAMPINMAVKVYNNIIREGHVTRGSIGISFDARDDKNLLEVYGGTDHGVFVLKVEPNGPSDKAGIKERDVIASINGKPIKAGQDLIDTVADTPVGTSLKLGVMRDKKPMTLDVVVGDRTKIFASLYGGAPSLPSRSDDSTQMKFGMSVQAITPAEKTDMNLKTGGVLVSSVEDGSFAYDIGLAKGDVIVELNAQAVNAPADIRRIQNNLKPGDSVAFHVMRQVGGSRGGGEWSSFFPSGRVPEGVQ